MTRGPLPRFNAREGLSSISASAMNRLVDVLENAEQRLVEVERRTLSNSDFERNIQRPKTVVIIKKPVDGDSTLRVLEAGYGTIPPTKCEGENPVVCNYRWYGVEFEVYPPLGKQAIDYEGDEFLDPSVTNPPKIDSKFHRIHQEREVWVLDLEAEGGGGGIRPAVVTVATAGALTITVQPMKRSGSTWIADGGTIVAPLWGKQTGDDFQTLIGSPTASVFDLIPLVNVGGEWYAMQYFWMYAKTPSTSIAIGDCAL